MSEAKRLGRGLEALLGPISREQAAAQGALRELPVGSIRPNPFQPRREFDPAALDELASSIEASGLLQPVVVRSAKSGYELIAGERRWRAVQQLGWQKVPAVVKEVDDRSLLTLALIENLQRDDLSPVDEARGYQRLMEEFKLAQGEVARLVGRNRSTVANSLRLLQLPADVQARLQDKSLSEGHARALLGLADPREISRIAAEVVERGWSVRETEALIRGEGPAVATVKPKLRRARPPVRAVHAEQRRVEDTLRKHLGTDVRVTAKRKGRGTISISYYSNDDLARLLELILGKPYD
ncbi:MAG TPA: ParB/RepB/Spo0J family partition protein [Gemmatimonadales bacterium]|nr:ParB/RepB/Spo0J family partition protein [Gemmatimonadales bacterium]